MAYVARMLEVPDPMPDFYPPPDDNDPGAFPLRYQFAQTLMHLMLHLGAVEDRPLDQPAAEDAPAPLAIFYAGGTVGAHQARIISRAMRPFIADGVSTGLFEELRRFWNQLQANLKAQTAARGEVAISGFEDFPYDLNSLRNDLVCWGAFNAIASDGGGYHFG
jgi:hypothetical protein